MFVCLQFLQRADEGIGPLELESKMIVSIYVDTGNSTWVVCKNSKWPFFLVGAGVGC